LGEVAPENK